MGGAGWGYLGPAQLAARPACLLRLGMRVSSYRVPALQAMRHAGAHPCRACAVPTPPSALCYTSPQALPLPLLQAQAQALQLRLEVRQAQALPPLPPPPPLRQDQARALPLHLRLEVRQAQARPPLPPPPPARTSLGGSCAAHGAAGAAAAPRRLAAARPARPAVARPRRSSHR